MNITNSKYLNAFFNPIFLSRYIIEITVRLSLSNYKLTENNSVNFSNNSIISEVNSLTFSPIKYVFYLKYK